MNIELLRHAVYKLRELQGRIDAGATKSGFDIDYWWNTNLDEDSGKPSKDGCGTVGCFIGWAAQERWFEQFGVPLALVNDCSTQSFDVKVGDEIHGAPRGVVRALYRHFGFEYAATLENLILGECYEQEKVEPRHVADKIERLIELGEDEFFAEQ